jgi:hypothetical protein
MIDNEFEIFVNKAENERNNFGKIEYPNMGKTENKTNYDIEYK